jgi:DNA-directed RNA polymerase specialized sigma24 family protein
MTNNAPPDLLTELYVAHYPGLVRLAAMLLDEPAACEDVVQEAYIRAAAAKGGLRDPDASLAYLRRTVVYLSRSRDAPPAGRHPLPEPQSSREQRVRRVAELP